MRNGRRRAGWTLAVVLGLVAGFWVVTNLQGKGEWARAQKRAATLGVSLRLEDYAAAPLPHSGRLLDNQLFAREWTRSVEPALNRWSSMGIEVPNPRGIHQRRGERIDYLKVFPGETDPSRAVSMLSLAAEEIEQRLDPLAGVILSHDAHDLTPRHRSVLASVESPSEVVVLQGFAAAFRDQALLALHRGDADRGFRNCKVIKRLAENFGEPDVLHLFVAEFLEKTIQSIVFEGIRLQVWEDHHLTSLSGLCSMDVVEKSLPDAFCYEAAFVSPSLSEMKEVRDKFGVMMAEAFDAEVEEVTLGRRLQDWIHFGGPRGWDQRRKAFVLNRILDQIESKDRWRWSRIEPVVIDLDEGAHEPFSFDPLASVREAGRTYSNSISKVFKDTSRKRLTQLAIQVERFRLGDGAYPSSVDDLPKGGDWKDPSDPEGRPLRYTRLPDGGFQIHSEFFEEECPDSEFDQLKFRFPSAA